jgi:hypothetical protein
MIYKEDILVRRYLTKKIDAFLRKQLPIREYLGAGRLNFV